MAEDLPSGRVTGYLHPAYAASLAEFGTPRELRRSGAWILEREVPGTPFHDAMGCYPLLLCRDWAGLGADLDDLAPHLVAFSAVTDPFADCGPAELAGHFRDLVRPFKTAFIVDLARPPERFVDPHHRRYARQALRRVAVERLDEPATLAEEWAALYAHLVRRHGITGMPAFSRAALVAQLRVPGAVAFRALDGAATVAVLLWYVHGPAAYYHLGASSPRGYELRASFALFWTAIEHFRAAGLRRLSLGGAPGLGGPRDDGLSRFKRGWATGARTVYLCGRILNGMAYDALAGGASDPTDGYFPAYRAGEFATSVARQAVLTCHAD